MTFWLGLRNHTFVTYMRTPWTEAVDRWKVNVVILDDFVMAGGGPSGEWKALRDEVYLFLQQNGQLIGEVDGGFYGELKVYSVHY